MVVSIPHTQGKTGQDRTEQGKKRQQEQDKKTGPNKQEGKTKEYGKRRMDSILNHLPVLLCCYACPYPIRTVINITLRNFDF